MLPDIECIRGEQVAVLGQVLLRLAVGVPMDVALLGAVRIGEVVRHPGGFR